MKGKPLNSASKGTCSFPIFTLLTGFWYSSPLINDPKNFSCGWVKNMDLIRNDVKAYRGYWERWWFAMLTFMYCSKGQGEAYILNYKTNTRDFVSIVNLSLVSSGGTIAHRHITLTSLLALLSNSSLLWNPPTKFILVITYEVPTLNMHGHFVNHDIIADKVHWRSTRPFFLLPPHKKKKSSLGTRLFINMAEINKKLQH